MTAPSMERLLTRVELAKLAGVVPATVTRWEKSGKLVPDPDAGSAHRRYRKSAALALAVPADVIGAGRAAEITGLHPNTLALYAEAGLLTCYLTQGRHKRYSEAEVRALAPDGPLLSAGEAAVLLKVDRRTVYRWGYGGKLKPASVTPGGHRRYREADVRALLRGKPPEAGQ